jgi:energy-coupling factor transport system substrate-specific component
VSWQLGAFSLLAIAIGGGFWWYERVRPDARIVALVGTLAAFAALGRIAFAAVPNVKPTSDIVLISGYALGGGPGFAVGALAGLVSNFFFGQGPWTPWQMAAWGATGMLGAGLATVTRGRIGRWPLAIVCCVAGFAFTVTQDFGDWVTYSDHSSAQLVVYVGKGLGFDAIHAAGCLLFALALGPVLTRSIQRFAARLQVVWLPAGAIGPLLAVVLIAGVTIGLHAPGRARAQTTASAPLSYLLSAQNPDGGYGAAGGQPSNALFAGWAALGLASAGHDPYYVRRDGHALTAYIASAPGSLSDAGSLERTILVARAAGLSATSFSGHDLTALLAGRIRRDGSVSDQVNLTAFAILAQRAAAVTPAGKTYAWLLAQQDRDGGFGFATAGSGSDVDDTGAVLEAIGGRPGAPAATARRRAVAFLRGQQNRNGGFPSQPGQSSNAQSTAWAIQGLDAAGISPSTLHRGRSVSPLVYLQGLIEPDGSVAYSHGLRQTPVWVTAEALMALQGRPLPIIGVAPAKRKPAAARSKRPAAAAPAPTHARRDRAHDRARRPRLGHRLPDRTGAQLMRLAAGVGLATALVLAPLDMG